MGETSDVTYIDLTHALQEFGFGPSDDSDDSDVDDGVTDDWDSIGLLPSWEKFQVTLRNASYNFITGSRREAAPGCQSQQTTPGSLNPESRRGVVIEDQPSTDDANSDNGIEDELLHTDEGDDPGDVKTSIFTKEPLLDDDIPNHEAEDALDEGDEWDEIGKFPTLNQLQSTLKNATGLFAMPQGLFRTPDGLVQSASEFLREQERLMSSGKIGWQTFIQNLQLPSFLGEDYSEDDVLPDVNDPKVAPLYADDDITAEDKVPGYNYEGLTGCQHYLRNCKSECSQCRKFFMCHLCHDDQVSSHQMDRKQTERMLCLNCLKPQPPRRKCVFCKEIMGDYYCSICKLWNDDPDKSIYHCDKCGICRVGRGIGIDVFHCDTCAICMSLSVENNHKCIEQAARSNCPICLDDLFSSPRPTVFMPCGHPIHRDCFAEYSKRYYRCPICSKSILNTSALFRMIDEEVQSEVLPPELADKLVDIICQDCRLKSRTQFHLAGLKCETCGSYNTAKL